VSDGPGIGPDGSDDRAPTRTLLLGLLALLTVALCASALAGLLLLLGGRRGPSTGTTSPSPAAGKTGRVNAKLLVRGDAVRPLVPGGPPVPIDLVFSNRGWVDLTVTGVRATVAGTDARGCRVEWFSVRTPDTHVLVPARTTRSLAQLGVPRSRWPRLRMTDTSKGQDACRNAVITLHYVATATG
jgi:hypothetical protein